MSDMPKAAGTAAIPVKPRPNYHSVQVLRGLAALMVVAFHIGGATGFESKLPGGGSVMSWANPVGALGVDLFFVISGFIMTVTTAATVRGVESARIFLFRRACRVYPAYLVITSVIFVFYLWRPGLVNSSQEVPPNVVASFLLLPQRGLPLLLVGWTLVYEMYFYLIFAVGLLAQRRAFPLVLAGWAAATLVVHQFVTDASNPFVDLFGSLLNLEFLVGVLVGYLVMNRGAVMPVVSVVAGLALFGGCCAFSLPSGQLPSDWVRVWGVAVGLALVLYGVIGLELRGEWRVPRPLVALGDSSYSLYLVHVPLLKVGAIVCAAILPAGWAFHLPAIAAAFVASVAGGWLYYRLVERPLLRLTNRWTKRRRTPA